MAIARIPGDRVGGTNRRPSIARLKSLGREDMLVPGVMAAIAGLYVLGAALFMASSASGESAGFTRLPLDEAWARLVYAESFSDHFSFQFNPGEWEAGATSPLWVALLGGLSWMFGISNEGLPALAKVTGISFGIATAWMAYRVTWQITGRHHVGALAGAVVAVEPHFTFAAVSGMETAMFAALALATAWAFMRGRTKTAGALAALTVATRPEGILLATLVFGSTVARWMWRREGAVVSKRQDVVELAYLGAPSLVVVIAWVVYNWTINGTPLPNAYHVRREDLGLFPVPNMWNVWLGYFHQLPFMYGLAWIVGLPVTGLGIWAVIRRHSFSAAPLALFAFALAYAAAVTFDRPGEEWMFADRRHMDAAAPFVTVLLFAGTVIAWRLIMQWRETRKPRAKARRARSKGSR